MGIKMLTPQDIQAKEFPKAVFGGYDMTAVDDFLEELEADYTALYKDNVALKSKLKVLVDKVEEYRSTEDAMRMALMTAQKMSDDMMAETQAKCDEMVRKAEAEANSKRNSLNEDLTLEIERLEAAKAETLKFVAASKKLVEDQARFLLKVDKYTHEMIKDSEESAPKCDEPLRSPEPEPGTPAVQSAPQPAAKPVKETSDTLKEIDDFVSDIMESVGDDKSEEYSSADLNTRVYDPSLDETKRVPVISDEDVKIAHSEWTEEDEEITPRPKFKFDDLQFGSNYKDE